MYAHLSHPLYYRRHDLEVEDGELQSHNNIGNLYLNQENGANSFTRQGEIETGVNDIWGIQKMSITTNGTSPVNWRDGDNQRQTQHLGSGLYCHLSYYGDEVDKEFLPDMTHSYTYDKSNRNNQYEYRPSAPVQHLRNSGFQQEDKDFQTVHSPHPRFNVGRTDTTGESGMVNATRRIDRTHSQYSHPHYRQPQTHFRQPQSHFRQHQLPYGQPQQNFHRGPEQLHTFNDFNIRPGVVVNLKQNVAEKQQNATGISPAESVCSFKSAASSFQEKQGRFIDAEIPVTTTCQGWSRVTSNPTIKRKVVFHTDDDNETKMQKRLNRFAEPVEFKSRSQRTSREMSLDEIIKRKKIQVEQARPGRRHLQQRNIPLKRTSSTWLSGDGKSFSDPRIAFRQENRSYCEEDESEYDGHHHVESVVHKMHHHDQANESRRRQQNRGWKYERYDSNTNPIFHAHTQRDGTTEDNMQFRPIVIDGSSVAFTYGEDLHFICEGIRICVDYFLHMGCKDITVIVPRDRLKEGASKGVHILHDLQKRKMLLMDWNGHFAGYGHDEDDRLFILNYANYKQGIIISNLSFTEVARGDPKLRYSIWNRVVNFHFTSAIPKQIVFHGIDDSGMYGSTWEDVFKF